MDRFARRSFLRWHRELGLHLVTEANRNWRLRHASPDSGETDLDHMESIRRVRRYNRPLDALNPRKNRRGELQNAPRQIPNRDEAGGVCVGACPWAISSLGMAQ